MNILFFYPSNTRTIPIDIPLFQLQERGHNIFLLTTSPRGPLHDLYEGQGAKVFTTNSGNGVGIIRLWKNIRAFIRVCRKYKINVAHSHLQQANVVAVLAQYFVETRVVVFRHHCKFHFLLPNTDLSPSRNEKIGDWIINRLAKKIVVPSKAIKDVMTKLEHVDTAKVYVIPYMYDFERMVNVNQKVVEMLTTKYPARLRIILVSRLTPYKRHTVALDAIVPLIRRGFDIQVLILDDGPELERIKSRIVSDKVESRIHLLGFRPNILDYIAAADVVVHPSLTEASNSAVKEAGLLEKVVLVCDGVGDFNDYIVNERNGFLLSPAHFSAEAEKIIETLYTTKDHFATIGKKLREIVTQRFNISEEVVDRYETI